MEQYIYMSSSYSVMCITLIYITICGELKPQVGVEYDKSYENAIALLGTAIEVAEKDESTDPVRVRKLKEQLEEIRIFVEVRGYSNVLRCTSVGNSKNCEILRGQSPQQA